MKNVQHLPRKKKRKKKNQTRNTLNYLKDIQFRQKDEKCYLYQEQTTQEYKFKHLILKTIF